MTDNSKPSLSQRVLGVALLLLAVVGCGGAPYDVAPAGGRVTLDGEPFTGASVMFAPVATDSYKVGKPAFARLEPDGAFELSTYGRNDGAVVGEHRVTLYRIHGETEQRKPGKPSLDDLKRKRPSGPLETWEEVAVPGKIVVSADRENSFEIELTTAMLAGGAHGED